MEILTERQKEIQKMQAQVFRHISETFPGERFILIHVDPAVSIETLPAIQSCGNMTPLAIHSIVRLMASQDDVDTTAGWIDHNGNSVDENIVKKANPNLPDFEFE